jgi:hypothetical protein
MAARWTLLPLRRSLAPGEGADGASCGMHKRDARVIAHTALERRGVRAGILHGARFTVSGRDTGGGRPPRRPHVGHRVTQRSPPLPTHELQHADGAALLSAHSPAPACSGCCRLGRLRCRCRCRSRPSLSFFSVPPSSPPAWAMRRWRCPGLPAQPAPPPPSPPGAHAGGARRAATQG